MTRQEIEKRIEEIEDRQFMLNMKDRWVTSDYELDNKLWREKQELKKMLDK